MIGVWDGCSDKTRDLKTSLLSLLADSSLRVEFHGPKSFKKTISPLLQILLLKDHIIFFSTDAEAEISDIKTKANKTETPHMAEHRWFLLSESIPIGSYTLSLPSEKTCKENIQC